MCAASSTVCDVCDFGHDTSGCAGDQTVVRPNIEHHWSYHCVELEVLAIRGLGDIQVSEEETLHGGSEHVFDCVDGVSEQGKELSGHWWCLLSRRGPCGRYLCLFHVIIQNR